MKDKTLYLVRATYKDMVLSDYIVGKRRVINICKKLVEEEPTLEKIEYGIAPYRSRENWCNWDKSTVVEFINKESEEN